MQASHEKQGVGAQIVWKISKNHTRAMKTGPRHKAETHPDDIVITAVMHNLRTVVMCIQVLLQICCLDANLEHASKCDSRVKSENTQFAVHRVELQSEIFNI